MKNRKEFSVRPLMRKTKWRRAGFLSRLSCSLPSENKHIHDAGLWALSRVVYMHTNMLAAQIWDHLNAAGVCLIFTSLALFRPECLHYLSLCCGLHSETALRVYPRLSAGAGAQRAPLWLARLWCDPACMWNFSKQIPALMHALIALCFLFFEMPLNPRVKNSPSLINRTNILWSFWVPHV